MTVRVLVALCFSLSVLASARAEAPAGESPDKCVQVQATAPFVGYAYNHVVEVKNGCSRPVKCEIWTDVDPTPHHGVALAPGETAQVLVRRGSPARAYTAEHACKF